VRKVEIDEMQSYTKNKNNVRWVWSILDHYSGELLAYVIGCRTTANFHKLMALIDDLGIEMHYTDRLNIYKGFFESSKHGISKYKMQRVERLHLTYRTRVKRLTRKTICYSKSILMHDTVIGLFINQYLFGIALPRQLK
jgi:insertion element IS1 protein InsB